MSAAVSVTPSPDYQFSYNLREGFEAKYQPKDQFLPLLHLLLVFEIEAACEVLVVNADSMLVEDREFVDGPHLN